jgi:protocatechuate 3,4-dioxygenase beta subunit
VERQLTRRQALGAAGAAGLAVVAARGELLDSIASLGEAAPASAATGAGCATLTPALTEGPYWIDEMLRRADVRANTASAAGAAGAVQQGLPLALRITVLDADRGCVPFNGAHVDIWHANAHGLYSGEAGQPSGGGAGNGSTQGQNFLRGYQVTGVDRGIGKSPVDGQVSFRTIWPGWYMGRAIHIHVRVRAYDGRTASTDYTTQIFFTDADNARVLSSAAPYNSRSPKTDPTTNETDNVLTSAARATNVVAATGSVQTGFAAAFTIMLHGLSASGDAAATSSKDTAVSASLRSARVVRNANGTRTLVLSVTAGEALTARARLLSGGKTLARAAGRLTAGTHALRAAVGAGATEGAATAELTLIDSAGNRRVLRRSVVLPA